jgi:hypothetical protein
MRLFTVLTTILLFGMPRFLACEKAQPPVLQEPITAPVVHAAPKVLSDGYFDIIVLGTGFKGPSGSNLFLQYKDSVVFWMSDLAPFFSHTNIRWHYTNVKGNLGCDDTVPIGEGLSCNTDKVVSAAVDAAAGAYFIDRVIVLAYGKGHAGAEQGGQIAYIGVGTGQNSPDCNFMEGFRKKTGHELGHTFGLIHQITFYGLMNPGCCGGCGLGDQYSPEEQAIIESFLN